VHDHRLDGHATSRAFAWAAALNVAFVLAEALFGLRAHSLALLSDAGHNLSDTLGLALAWTGSALARVPPSGRHTYGLRGASILAALGNAVLLLLVVGATAWEAIRRLHAPEPVAGFTVMTVAAVGVVVNGAAASLFCAGRGKDILVRGAFLHMLADAAVSVAVVLAGAGIVLTGRQWLDPAASLLVSAAIVLGTWRLLRDALHLATDAVPAGIDLAAVERLLAQWPGVTAVHDLHIWAMSTTETSLTAHLLDPAGRIDYAELARLARQLRERFGIEHTTIQVECGAGDAPCEQASPGAV